MRVDGLKKELKNKKAIEACARCFGVIGDTTRLKICYLLCNHPELSVSEIAAAVDVSISAVSHSLKKLKTLKLVTSRRNFRTVYYSWGNKELARIIQSQL